LVVVAEGYKHFFPGIEKNPVLIFFAVLSGAVIIFPLGGLCYRFLEKPSIAWGKRVLKRRSQRLGQQKPPGCRLQAMSFRLRRHSPSAPSNAQ
jgi:peptidoglycan/LPS O-acetylase OafA/YrhL